MGSEESETERQLAVRISQLRQSKFSSLEDFSNATGISKSTLSRIERFETSPTAQNLGRIAAALGVTCSELFQSVETRSEELYSANSRQVWSDKSNGFTRAIICPPSRERICELTECKLPIGTKIEYPVPLKGGVEEIIYVRSGRLVFCHNNEEYELGADDALRFTLIGHTSFYNPGPETAEYLIIIGQK